MVQQGKAVPHSTDNLSSLSRTHVKVGGETQIYELSPTPHMSCPMYTPHTHTSQTYQYIQQV